MRRYNTLLKGIAIAVMALTSMISFDAQSQYNRPQTPVPPYPYDTLEYVVNNTKANVQLSGTLTMPDNPKAVIVMATGSGSQNRDEEMFGHRPFKVIADYLSRNGYAVLRTDDRGIGQSTGDATLATTDDFAEDAKYAVESLKKLDALKDRPVGIIGHSEGGSIAIKCAPSVDFIVTLAAPAIQGDSIILTQTKAMLDASGQGFAWDSLYPTLRKRYDTVMSNLPTSLLKIQLYNDVVKDIPPAMLTDQLINQINAEISAMCSPWYRTFLRYNPAEDIRNIDIPWLALNGTKDLQVLCEDNTSTIKQLNPNATVVVFDGLNHLFQQCSRGTVDEYAIIEQTISPQVLETILNWLNTSIATD